jgi:general secretion pathway protein E
MSVPRNSAGEFEMERHARRNGPGIRADGLRRIRAGETSIEEVLRVTPAGDSEAATVIE